MNQSNTIQVWDILVRIFHWSLVLAFIVAYMSSEEENPLHIYSGYAVLGLICFRVIWGIVGSRYARFSNFIYSPASVMGYLKSARAGQPQHYLGHNPLGGWMVMALLTTLFVVTLSGLMVYQIEEAQEGREVASTSGGLTLISAANAEQERESENETEDNERELLKADAESEDKESEAGEAGEEFWEEIHEISSNFMLFLIALHLLGVVQASRLHKENLVIAMLTGKKRQS